MNMNLTKLTVSVLRVLAGLAWAVALLWLVGWLPSMFERDLPADNILGSVVAGAVLLALAEIVRLLARIAGESQEQDVPQGLSEEARGPVMPRVVVPRGSK